MSYEALNRKLQTEKQEPHKANSVVNSIAPNGQAVPVPLFYFTIAPDGQAVPVPLFYFTIAPDGQAVPVPLFYFTIAPDGQAVPVPLFYFINIYQIFFYICTY